MKEIVRQFFNWSFSGEYPDIPVDENIIAELLKDDPSAMFVTLPISQMNGVADDGLVYDAQLNDKLHTVINTQRPTGNMGHLKEEDRGSKFDVPAVVWLASQYDNEGRLWAKAYVLPNEEIRQFIRVSKTTRRGIATSIYGYSTEPFISHMDGNYSVNSDAFVLESIDLAPIERAALKMERPLTITSQMEDGKENKTMPLTAELIAQMTPEQVGFLPAPVLEAIVAQYKAQDELTSKVSLLTKDNTELMQIIEQMKQETTQREQQVYDSLLDAEIDAVVKVDDEDGTLHSVVRNAVAIQMGSEKSIEKAKTVLAQYAETPTYKRLAEMYVSQVSGGKVIAGNGSLTNRGSLGEEYEKRISELRKSYGLPE